MKQEVPGIMDDGPLTGSAELDLKLLASAKVGTEGRRGSGTVKENNYFRSAEWTPDGTCVITNSADNHIRTFIVPPNLLEDRSGFLRLEPYSIIPSLEPVNTLACYPNYNLQEPSTALVLSTATEHPIRLHSALTKQLVASYALVSPTTEAYIKPQSLLFTSNGNRFIAGSESLISTFDVSRSGDGPISVMKTGPKNNKSSWSNPGTALRGLVSALDIDQQYNVLAAGTLTRQVGLYDAAGQGDCVGVFSLAGSESDDIIAGGGVTQVIWSSCGRYLYVVERKSEGAVIYDIRRTGQLLSWLSGRRAMTNQRMKVELAASQRTGDQDVWAGGTDGKLRYWEAPHLKQGLVAHTWEVAVHQDVVNSVGMHQAADVLVTASGQRKFVDSDIGSEPSLMLWQHRRQQTRRLHQADDIYAD